MAKRIEAGLYAAYKLEADGGLSDEMRADLNTIVRQGELAKEKMITSNFGLVVSIAKRYRGRMEFTDLIQEGNVGLLKAVMKFDYTKGVKLSTYATEWIRAQISHAVAWQGRAVRLPVHIINRLHKMNRVEERLHKELSRAPTPDELAGRLGHVSPNPGRACSE